METVLNHSVVNAGKTDRLKSSLLCCLADMWWMKYFLQSAFISRVFSKDTFTNPMMEEILKVFQASFYQHAHATQQLTSVVKLGSLHFLS